MYFKQLLDERYGCASYVVASRQSHEAAIVDPSLDVEQYEILLRERGLERQHHPRNLATGSDRFQRLQGLAGIGCEQEFDRFKPNRTRDSERIELYLESCPCESEIFQMGLD